MHQIVRGAISLKVFDLPFSYLLRTTLIPKALFNAKGYHEDLTATFFSVIYSVIIGVTLKGFACVSLSNGLKMVVLFIFLFIYLFIYFLC